MVRQSDDPYAAFCIDEAVLIWGQQVESVMEEAASESHDPRFRANARQNAFSRMMQNEDEPVAKGRFADPAALINK